MRHAPKLLGTCWRSVTTTRHSLGKPYSSSLSRRARSGPTRCKPMAERTTNPNSIPGRSPTNPNSIPGRSPTNPNSIPGRSPTNPNLIPGRSPSSERGLGLAGKVAFVTGATSNIGLAIAELFTGEGARVIVHSTTTPGSRVVAERLGADAVGADLRDPAAIVNAFDEVRRRHGRLDILVNSAAQTLRKDLLGTTLE